MISSRITEHPILPIPDRHQITFFWQSTKLTSFQNETIASALIANDIQIFGYHPKDHTAQGIFCANGQCSQCMVIANGKPVKSCMVFVEPGMVVEPVQELPVLPFVSTPPILHPIKTLTIPALIIGGGPAGLSAGIELGKLGAKAILIDDKHRLGGKLILQTHRFFGSVQAVYAGTRGIDIATKLESELMKLPSIDIWLQSTALAIFSDKKVGILKNGNQYILIEPQVILIATGAREKFLTFEGNTLPGVYGAGAFQTLVNRDLVKPAKRLFIIGGGNVGLITGYHALQAGIEVIGLVETMPECGGYKVHRDKLMRMGVPIYTSHTILSANGKDKVESVTIGKIDNKFCLIPCTEKSFACDSVLIAVGLDPVNELLIKAKIYQIPVFAAGDAEEIAEASAAIFSGKIRGVEIAKHLNLYDRDLPISWKISQEILRSKPGITFDETIPEFSMGTIPVIHCNQEIPCDPCSQMCVHGLISIDPNDIRKVPIYQGNSYCCGYCERCVAVCPGLAITLVDYRSNPFYPIVSIPYEFNRGVIKVKDKVVVLDTKGTPLVELEVINVHQILESDRTLIIQVQAPRHLACLIAGIRIQEEYFSHPFDDIVEHKTNDNIICRCERVTVEEIRQVIRSGVRDLNEIKAITRYGMGACGSKTCNNLVLRIFMEEQILLDQISENTKRPLFIEVPMGVFAGIQTSKDILSGDKV
jgi:sarcosine oxidase subunit alpha